MDYKKESLRLHEAWQGKIETVSRVPVSTADELSLAYTPGVAEPCLEIEKHPEKSFTLTRRHNLCLVVTDGTAVLGLGDIGPEAGMPVMEGKCVLFKEFGGVDAFPLCIKSKDVDEIVRTIYLISGSFGGINLEDIAAPRCFEIERKLKEICDIPVFHDDQHGTAVVLGAALLNTARLLKKDFASLRCVINGAGSAGCAIFRHLTCLGVRDIILCDKKGILDESNALHDAHREICKISNPRGVRGLLKDAIKGADVFIGVSAPNVVTEEMIASMNPSPAVFPMANPVPEIAPDKAKAAGAAVVGTGRSDFANQINNVLAFPGIFRGALDVRAKDINREMCIAASHALADLITDDELSADYILPKAFDKRICPHIAAAVREAAQKSGVAQIG